MDNTSTLTIGRSAAWLSIALSALLMALEFLDFLTRSAPIDALDPVAFFLVIVVSVTEGVLFGWLIRSQCLTTATVMAAFSLVYAPHAATAMSYGFHAALLAVEAVYVRWAFVVVALFIVTTNFCAGLLEKTYWPADGPRDHHKRFASTTLMLGVCCAAAAFFYGTWTYYGTARVDSSGQFRLDYLYEPVLASIVVLSAHRTVTYGDRRWFIVLLLSGALLFALQSRRLMIGYTVMVSLGYLFWNRGRFRPLWLLAGSAAVVLTLYGSYVWRESALAGEQGVDLVRDTVTLRTHSDASLSSVVDTTNERLTYLWTEAASVQYFYDRPFLPSVLDVFVSQSVIQVPGAVFPAKYSIPTVSCETAFRTVGVAVDIACTPIGEGLVFGGLSFLALVSVLWTLCLTAAGVLMRLRTDLTIVLSCIILRPMLVIETSAFPQAEMVRCVSLALVLQLPFLLILSLPRTMRTWRSPLTAQSAR